MIDSAVLLDKPEFATLVSILLGFGLAAIFRPLCKGPDCLVIRGPPINDIRGAVYQFGAKCVEFDAKPIECPKKGEIVETMSFIGMD